MANKVAVRKIVKIDEDKCNGCGQCVPSCAEGAIRIVDGKARLAAENLCDGLGNCLGECPQGAITIEERSAEDFDEQAVREHLGAGARPAGQDHAGRASHAAPQGYLPDTKPMSESGSRASMPDLHASHPAKAAGHAPADGSMAPGMAPPIHAGCPGAMARLIRRPAPPSQTHASEDGSTAPRKEHAPADGSMAPGMAPGSAAAQGGTVAGAAAPSPSQLTQWPVQLTLVPVGGPIWQDADVLIAADCVPFALPEFHEKLLAGRKLAIACPKLDDVGPYVEKLAAIFSQNTIRSVTVAHMEVPCCGGIVRVVQAALQQAGRTDIPFRDVTVTIEGEVVG